MKKKSGCGPGRPRKPVDPDFVPTKSSSGVGRPRKAERNAQNDRLVSILLTIFKF